MAERDEISTTSTRPVDVVGPGASSAGTPETRGWRQWLRLDHIPEAELAVFWRQLALLIEVGMPLLKALYQVAERTSHRPLRRVIQRVAAGIEAGNSLSEALAQHPHAFSTLTVQVLQVAERGGVLDDSLRLVAEELERRVEIRGKVRRALAYPTTVLAVGLTVVLFVLAYVIPEFTVIFQDQAVELPLLTRVVIGTAHFLARFWWLCVLGVVALGLLCASYIRTPGGRLRWDRLKLRLPLVGALLGKACILRFAQTLGTLLRGGVPILVSLKLVQEHAENSVLAGELAHVYAAVDQGSRLEVPLRQCRVFPPEAIDVIAIGEEAGQLDTVLFRLAQMYKEEVDHSISVFASVLEPLLLFVMGLFVALIVWAVYLPYFMLPGVL
ncbi:MAG TPA: type II secretion system F family protein [Candidatus Tectomicrobia bacterium]